MGDAHRCHRLVRPHRLRPGPLTAGRRAPGGPAGPATSGPRGGREHGGAAGTRCGADGARPPRAWPGRGRRGAPGRRRGGRPPLDGRLQAGARTAGCWAPRPRRGPRRTGRQAEGAGLRLGRGLLRADRRPGDRRVRAAGDDFLARVCQEWEDGRRSRRRGRNPGWHARTGLVVAGQAGPGDGCSRCSGSAWAAGWAGRQYWSFISLRDEVAALRFLLERVEPPGRQPHRSQPVTNGEVTAAMGRVLRRPTLCAVPEARCGRRWASSRWRWWAATGWFRPAAGRRGSGSAIRPWTRRSGPRSTEAAGPPGGVRGHPGGARERGNYAPPRAPARTRPLGRTSPCVRGWSLSA